ncbi:MAG: ABC transporter ATP-binding protein [Chloroflexota bacterium]|nr:ABC transporter ATP-binding protein [Chloroflexota bacterium]
MSIQLNNVNKRYSTASNARYAVQDVSLEVATGELFVLLGASGSGKSTLLRMIAGLIQPDGGRITLGGRDVTHLPPQARDTGFVFQNYSLFQHMTVAQNIAFGLTVRKRGVAPMNRAEREARVAQLLRLVELDGYDERMPYQLSGGQQQRIALARALAPNPAVLLLDEPFGALDVKIRGGLRARLRAIQQELNMTTILVTHDQEEAFELADRIGVIDQGELLEVGQPTQLYRRPTQRFTATFLGIANLLPAHRNSRAVHIGGQQIAAPAGTEALEGQNVDLMFRPEEVELAHSVADLRGQYVGVGVVESVSFAGAMERATIRLIDPLPDGVAVGHPASMGHPSAMIATETADIARHSTAELPLIQVVLMPGAARALEIARGQRVCVGVRDYTLLAKS